MLEQLISLLSVHNARRNHSMSNKLSVEILLYVKENPRASPLLIARSLLRRPGLVRNHLVVLSELELIEAPVRGNYLITKLGINLLDSLLKKDAS